MKVRHPGMTLVELLVALALLAIAAPLAYRGLDSLLVANERTEQQIQHWQTLAFGFERIETDLLQALPRPARSAEGARQNPWLGEQGAFEFSRWRDGRPPQRVRYFVKDESLWLQQWPLPDRGRQQDPEALILIDGLKEARFSYLDGGGNSTPVWVDATSLPLGLGIELTLVSGERITRFFALP